MSQEREDAGGLQLHPIAFVVLRSFSPQNQGISTVPVKLIRIFSGVFHWSQLVLFGESGLSSCSLLHSKNPWLASTSREHLSICSWTS